MLPLFLTFVLSSQYEELSPKLLVTAFQNLSPECSPLLFAAECSSYSSISEPAEEPEYA